jgi:hypothetical protein
VRECGSAGVRECGSAGVRECGSAGWTLMRFDARCRTPRRPPPDRLVRSVLPRSGRGWRLRGGREPFLSRRGGGLIPDPPLPFSSHPEARPRRACPVTSDGRAVGSNRCTSEAWARQRRDCPGRINFGPRGSRIVPGAASEIVRSISLTIGVSCSPGPWQLRHRGDVEQGPASARTFLMTQLAMLGRPRSLVSGDGGADTAGGCGSEEREDRKVSLQENFDTHLHRGFHGGDASFLSRM